MRLAKTAVTIVSTPIHPGLVPETPRFSVIHSHCIFKRVVIQCVHSQTTNDVALTRCHAGGRDGRRSFGLGREDARQITRNTERQYA